MANPSYEVADDRDLTAEEYRLVRWMLENGKPIAADFLSQLPGLRVWSRCACGCASINFAIDGRPTPWEGGTCILADFNFETAADHFGGIFVFAHSGKLAGLEVYSMDGLSTQTALPSIDQLEPVDRPIGRGGRLLADCD